jgi:hypothetical protein
MVGGDRADVERLRAYWDGVVQGDPTVPDELDPGNAAVVRQLHAWYRPPRPDPAFHVRLQEELMHSATVPAAIATPWSASPIATSPNRQSAAGSTRLLPRRPAATPVRMLSYLTSAALVVVTLVAAYLALDPSRHGLAPTGPSANLPVLLAPATPTPGGTTDEVLLETTLFGLVYDFPTTPALIHLDRIQLPPGASVSFPADDLDLSAYTIESGLLTINMMDDVPVTRHGQLRGNLYGGEDTQLKPGDGFVRKATIGGEIRNDGTEPVVYAVIRIVPETPEEPASAPGL